jgi:maltooligosyltrehalose trehalohydrolase
VRAAREAAGARRVYLVAENEAQQPELVREYGFDAVWNDDVHHSAIVALTGKREAYYSDHAGTPQELVSAARFGYLFQGQRYARQKKRRGGPALDLPPAAFVSFLENHDQVANTPGGARAVERTTPGRFRAMSAYLLLGPETPLLFQGQELGSRAPFVFFADHNPELARAVYAGRRRFLAQFNELASPDAQARIEEPADPATFAKCKLDRTSGDERVTALYRDLLALRRRDPAFAAPTRERVEGAVLGAEAFVLRSAPRGERAGGSREGDRALVVNLGADLTLASVAEPLMAPPRPSGWRVLFSTEETRYGGAGAAPIETDSGFFLPAHAAAVLG